MCTIRVENEKTRFTRKAGKGQVLRIPIAHFDGNYYAPPETLREIEDGGRVAFRYCEPDGSLSDESNVNGSLGAIAGLVNKAGNVCGLMPHPERAAEALLGSVDGRVILESLLESL